MTAFSPSAYAPGRLARLGLLVLNAGIGTLLCTGPVTALIALGWLARRSGHLALTRFGTLSEAPGWVLGPRETGGKPAGRIARLLGGLAGNIRAGAIALIALLAWTLPFTILWLGAWWAGWENSFNKGYEQAFVGPSVFLLGVVIAALVLPALPLMLAHLAVENRLSAAFELRRLRAVVAQSGWRVPALSLLAVAITFPFAALRGLITTATDWAPWVETLTPEEVASLQGQIALVVAGFTFLALWTFRSLAARTYASAAPRAAGLRPGLWDGSAAAEAAVPARPPSRVLTALWYGSAVAMTLVIAFLILAGQFLDHAWWRWLFHPILTLLWAG